MVILLNLINGRAFQNRKLILMNRKNPRHSFSPSWKAIFSLIHNQIMLPKSRIQVGDLTQFCIIISWRTQNERPLVHDFNSSWSLKKPLIIRIWYDNPYQPTWHLLSKHRKWGPSCLYIGQLWLTYLYPFIYSGWWDCNRFSHIIFKSDFRHLDSDRRCFLYSSYFRCISYESLCFEN